MAQPLAITTVEELTEVLEPLIRRVVREELSRDAQGESDTLTLVPGTPLHDDLKDIQHRKEQNRIELFSHEEVWRD